MGDNFQTVNEPVQAKLKPLRIQIDFNTPLENFFIAMTFGCATLTALGLFLVVFALPALVDGKVVAAGGLVGTIFFAVLAFKTDNYYVVDLASRRLLYHFSLFDITRVSVVCHLSEIAAFATGGSWSNGKRHIHWYYRTLMLTNNGRVIPLSNWRREFERDRARMLALQLSEVTGARHIEIPQECMAKVLRGRGNATFVAEPLTCRHLAFDWLMRFCIAMLLLGAILFLAGR